MNAESGPVASADTPTPVVDQSAQRCRPRQKIHTLVYINLNQGNGGIVRDLSENGIAVQAVARLRQHQQVYLRFELLSPRTRVEAMGQVTWANASGQAGVQFTQISQRTRYLLKEWLWLNLLDTAGQLSSASPIFGDERQNARDKLIVSGEPRPAIHLRSKEASSLTENQDTTSVLLEFSWWPVPISAGTLSGLVDGLIISASVLLFSFVFLAISHTLPSWPVSTGMAFLVACSFIALYKFLFAVYCGTTPGSCLVSIAALESQRALQKEDEAPRFR